MLVLGTNFIEIGTTPIMPTPRRVAIMLDLSWPFKRHARVFAGTQQFAQEYGWLSIMDEYVDKTLSKHSPLSIPYDGIIARATKKLALRAARPRVLRAAVCAGGALPDQSADGRLYRPDQRPDRVSALSVARRNPADAHLCGGVPALPTRIPGRVSHPAA